MDKWSGSVEVGVTVHDPGAVPIPSTMTNMRTGTSMMSGRGILANGKGVRREYGDFNLDDLKVPPTVRARPPVSRAGRARFLLVPVPVVGGRSYRSDAQT